MGFPGGSVSKESACNAGDPGLIPGSGRSTGEGNSYPLQYSCLENSMDRGIWQAIVHETAKNQTRLSNIFTLSSKDWILVQRCKGLFLGHSLSALEVVAPPYICFFLYNFSSVQFISVTQVMPSNHLVLCHPLLLPPSIFPNIKVFSNESSLCTR